MVAAPKPKHPQIGACLEHRGGLETIAVVSDHDGKLWRIDVVAGTARPVKFEKAAAKPKARRRKKR